MTSLNTFEMEAALLPTAGAGGQPAGGGGGGGGGSVYGGGWALHPAATSAVVVENLDSLAVRVWGGQG